jgi:hypothetical protein
VEWIRRTAPSLPWRYHDWIKFEDTNGLGGAEPELWALCPAEILLVEVKLTGCEYGRLQMRDLYAPLLSHMFGGRPVRCLQICRSVAPNTPVPIIHSLANWLAFPEPYATLHWTGA